MPSVTDLGRAVKAKYPGQYDDIPDADLGSKVKAKYPAYTDYADEVPPPRAVGDSVKDFAGSFWEKIGGDDALTVLKGILPHSAPESKAAAMDVMKRIGSGIAAIPAQMSGELAETGKAMVSGDAPGAAWHAAGAVPVLGPALQQATNEVDRGEYARAAGSAAALAAPAVAPKIPAVAKAAVKAVPAGAARAAGGMLLDAALAKATGGASLPLRQLFKSPRVQEAIIDALIGDGAETAVQPAMAPAVPPPAGFKPQGQPGAVPGSVAPRGGSAEAIPPAGAVALPGAPAIQRPGMGGSWLTPMDALMELTGGKRAASAGAEPAAMAPGVRMPVMSAGAPSARVPMAGGVEMPAQPVGAQPPGPESIRTARRPMKPAIEKPTGDLLNVAGQPEEIGRTFKAESAGPEDTRLMLIDSQDGKLVIAVKPGAKGASRFNPNSPETADLHELNPDRISRRIGDEQWKGELRKKGLDPDNVVGFAHFGTESGNLSPGMVYTAPELRRKGLATSMYDMAKQESGMQLGAGTQKPMGRAFRQSYDARNAEAGAEATREDLGAILKQSMGDAAAPLEKPKAGNPYQEAARMKKASEMRFLLQKWNISAADAALMGEEQWGMLEKAARMKGSSAETRRMVIEQLKRLESSPIAGGFPE